MFVVAIVAIVFVYFVVGGIVSYLVDPDECDVLLCIFWPAELFIGGAVEIGIYITKYFNEKRCKRLLKRNKEEKRNKSTKNSPIRYLCNGKECRQGCNNPDCKLTTKIEFAKNFKKDVDGGYTEKEEK